MNVSRVVALCLYGMGLTAAVLDSTDSHHHVYRGLHFQSDLGTENEYEYSTDAAVVASESATATRSSSSALARSGTKDTRSQKLLVGGVGGFHLDTESTLAQSCDMIQAQFRSHDASATVCTCAVSMWHGSAVKFGCEQTNSTCSDDVDRDDGSAHDQRKVCARSVYAGTVSREQPVLSADVCLRDLIVGDEPRGQLCIAFEYITTRSGRGGVSSDTEDDDDVNVGDLAKCRARIGPKNCQCSVCGGGKGIRLDCSSVDQSLVSYRCDEIDLVTSIWGEASSIATYFPSFK